LGANIAEATGSERPPGIRQSLLYLALSVPSCDEDLEGPRLGTRRAVVAGFASTADTFRYYLFQLMAVGMTKSDAVSSRAFDTWTCLSGSLHEIR
jgi:hypothetical protein